MALSKDPTPIGREETYTERLIRLQTVGWKRFIPVQLPYALHLKALALPGSTLEVGCGIGRNLRVLGPSAVGVDIDRESVAYVVQNLRLRAFTPDEFFDSAYAKSRFDSLLLSHVLEHVDPSRLDEMVSMYLPNVRPGGRVIIITPQERGHESDPTHICLFDFGSGAKLARTLGLAIDKQYSFPFPRRFGELFRYNEFVTLLRLPEASSVNRSL